MERNKPGVFRRQSITGDHVTTAAGIAGQLGIEGNSMSVTEFGALSDYERGSDATRAMAGDETALRREVERHEARGLR